MEGLAAETRRKTRKKTKRRAATLVATSDARIERQCL